MLTITFNNSTSRAHLKLFKKIWSTTVKELSLTPAVVNNENQMEEISLKMPWGKISGKKLGKENKDKILCLHGWLDNCNTFDKLVPHLPKDKHYVLIDFPGHGKSSHYHEGTYYSWIQYVDVLERVRRRLKWNTFSILGHSLGANVGTVYSSVFAEKVERLIIIDTLGIHPYPMSITSEVLRKSIEKYQDYEESNKNEKQYTYEDAKRRLMKGNEDLSEEAAEILLKRGLKKVKDG